MKHYKNTQSADEIVNQQQEFDFNDEDCCELETLSAEEITEIVKSWKHETDIPF